MAGWSRAGQRRVRDPERGTAGFSAAPLRCPPHPHPPASSPHKKVSPFSPLLCLLACAAPPNLPPPPSTPSTLPLSLSLRDWDTGEDLAVLGRHTQHPARRAGPFLQLSCSSPLPQLHRAERAQGPGDQDSSPEAAAAFLIEPAACLSRLRSAVQPAARRHGQLLGRQDQLRQPVPRRHLPIRDNFQVR